MWALILPFFLLLSSLRSSTVQAIGVPSFLNSQELYASSVSYCSPPNAILVEQFQLKFYRNNNSIAFNIHAQSVLPNLYPTIAVSLVAYGKSVLNQTYDICSLFGGVICPLPQYDFHGVAVIPLPSSVIPNIPKEAYIVPNLDATAKIELIDNVTGAVVACIRASLSNGLSTHVESISLTVGLIVLVAFLLISFRDLSSHPESPLRSSVILGTPVSLEPPKSRGTMVFQTVIKFFQHISLTGFLTLQTPGAYLGFTENFAWSNLLIYVKAIQSSLNSFGKRTGADDDSLGFVGRAANFTYTNLTGSGNADGNTLPFPFASTAKIAEYPHVEWERFEVGPLRNVGGLSKRQSVQPASGDVEGIPYVQNEGSIPTSGLEIVATDLNIQPGALFMTSFINFLILLGLTLVFMTLLYLLCLGWMSLLKRRYNKRQSVLLNEKGISASKPTIQEVAKRWRWRFFACMMALRVLITCYFPLSLFSFYTFSLGPHASWVFQLFAALILAILTILLILVCLTPLQKKRDRDQDVRRAVEGAGLVAEEKDGARNDAKMRKQRWYGPVDSVKECWEEYNVEFKPKGKYWFLPFVLMIELVEAAVVGFAQNHGLLQVIFLVVLSTIHFLAHLLIRPYISKFSNFLTTVLSLFRVAVIATLIPFALKNHNISALTRAIIGFVLIGVEAVGILVVILSVIVFCIWWAVRRAWRAWKSRERKRQQHVEDGVEEEQIRAP
ncbi:hypothetical protein BT69DRAFT_1316464 [Atractiella rhizophila]|nr:hypothetical protein BT69DRAFT_1316464 [Atractiella rhizophila]